MKLLRNTLDRLRPTFSAGGRLSALHSLFEGLESFLFVPRTTARSGAHIRDAMDSKRALSLVVLALLPCLLFGIYNTGYQHHIALGLRPDPLPVLLYGLRAVLPLVAVVYAVGLSIEFTIAQWKGHDIQEGFLVTGLILPLTLPIDTPLWMVGLATAFAVIFAKEIFGGTGFNIWNIALVARAFLFFAYPSRMSGDQAFIRTGGPTVDGFTGATPLAQTHTAAWPEITDSLGANLSNLDLFLGLFPGSIGETSKLCILLGGIFLLATGIANWRTMASVFTGGLLTAALFHHFAAGGSPQLPPLTALLTGGFAFGAVFMATDPVTSPRTQAGKYIFGLATGALAITIRSLNPAYPEGMMLALLLMNSFVPLIDHCVLLPTIARRNRRTRQTAAPQTLPPGPRSFRSTRNPTKAPDPVL
jgi:Na+-transporting NADH:ubiquinone oxidoreductase subunit B